MSITVYQFKLFIALGLLALLLNGCGGDTRTNPHNELYDVNDTTSSPTQGDTTTTNNETESAKSERKLSLEIRNATCDSGGANLSTAAPPKYIMVGDDGKILISDNDTGNDWRLSNPSNITENMNDVVKGRNIFIAVGDHGKVLCSPNGYDWFPIELKWEKDKQMITETSHLYGVATNGNQFVIVGANGAIYTNKGSSEWERNGFIAATTYYDIIWTKEQYIVVGGDPDRNNEVNIMNSLDGISWLVLKSSADQSMKKVFWTGSQFLAAGSRIVPAEPKQPSCTENCKTEPYLYVSNDGYLWTSQTIKLTNKISNAQLTALTGDENNLVAIGHGFNSDDERIPVSFILAKTQNDNKWLDYTMQDISPSRYQDALITDGDTYANVLLLGSGQTGSRLDFFSLGNLANNLQPALVATSEFAMNTIARIEAIYPAQASCPVPDLKKVVKDEPPVYYGSMHVVVGEGGQIFASPKGDNWQAVTSGTTKTLREVIRKDNAFYAVGDAGALLCSRNGFDWHVLPSNTNKDLTSIASDGKIYVAVGDGGIILTSVNGVQWDANTHVTAARINRIIWDGSENKKRFIAIGGDDSASEPGMMLESKDGEHWTAIAIADGVYLNDIVWNGYQFITVGYERLCSNSICRNKSYIALSSDGQSWQAQSIPPNSQFSNTMLTQVAAIGNEVIAVGRGDVAAGGDALILSTNAQETPWLEQVFSESAATGYNDLIAHEGSYWFAGERGLVAYSALASNSLITDILNNKDFFSIAINGDLPAMARVDKPFRYAPVIRDPEGQRLTLSASGLDSWVTLDSHLGILFGTPTTDNLPKPDEAQIDVIFSIRQETSTPAFAVSEPFEDAVVNNRPPQISGTSVEAISIANNESYFFKPKAYDPDGQQLYFSINTNGHPNSMPQWAEFDPVTGILYGKPSLTDIGVYEIHIDVDDDVTDDEPPVSLDSFSLKISNLPLDVSL